MIEFEVAALKRPYADGVKPSTLGSSGILDRNWSSLSLNSSTVIPERFVMEGGRQLKSLGPLTWKDCSLRLLIAKGPFS